MNKKQKILVIVIPLLLIIEVFSLFLTFKSFSNKDIDIVKEESSANNKYFAFYLQNSSGTGYTQSQDSTFPTGYELDITQSKCVNNSGTTVSASTILSNVSDGKVKAASSQTIYCTLYFNIAGKNLKNICGNSNLSTCVNNNKSQLSKVPNLNSSIQGNLYRYQGSSVTNNYVCVGAESCTANDEKLYRIIGITNSGELKLIKNTPISGTYYYDKQIQGSYDSSWTWKDSQLKTNLNGSLFYSTLSSSVKSNIVNYNWPQAQVLWDQATSGINIYDAENKTKSNAYIGLMSLADYYFAYGNGTSNCKSTTCNSWLTYSGDEWVITTLPMSGYIMPAYHINNGTITSDGVACFDVTCKTASIRPSFYLKNSITIKSGTGTSNDPYILNLPDLPEEERNLNNGEECKGGGVAMSYCVLYGQFGEIRNLKYSNDMYRYQGTASEVDNNYICIGGSDCLPNSPKMFRIIGITSDGKMKIISNYSQAHDTMSSSSSVDFWNSSLYKWYNDDHMNYWDYVLPLENMIVSGRNGNTLFSSSTSYGTYDVLNKTGSQIYNLETSSNRSGMMLMDLSDYYLAAGDNVNCSTSPTTCKNSWLHLGNKGMSSQREWIMSKGSAITYCFMVVTPDGYVSCSGNNGTEAADSRPVVYLSNSVRLGGKGTVSEPYYITNEDAFNHAG